MRTATATRATIPALAPAIAGPHLSAALGFAGACHILDAKLGPDRGTVLYDLGGRAVLGVLHRPAIPPGVDVPALDLAAYPFPYDPALGGLPALLEAGALAAVLARTLSESVVRASARVVRYRPGRRVTLQIESWTRAAGAFRRSVYFGKVYHDVAKAEAVVADATELAATPSVREGHVLVSRVAGFDPSVPLVLQTPIAGTPLDAILASSQAGALIAEAGRALAALHGVGRVGRTARLGTAEVGKMRGRAQVSEVVTPEVRESMLRTLDRLGEMAPSLAPRLHTFTHGDCKPAQFLAGSRMAILDFDHGGLTDPATDLGTFLATLRQAALSGEFTTERAASLARTFLDAYDDPAIAPRAAWYEALALLRKAQRAAARSPRSPVPAALVAAAATQAEAIERGAA